MQTRRERRRESPLLTSRKEWFSSLGIIVLMIGIYFIAPLGHDDPLSLPAAAAVIFVAVLAMAFLIGGQVRQTFVDSTSVKLARLTVLLTLTILSFAVGYFTLERSAPGEIAGLETRLDSLYFTLVTLGTIGYGDIHPAGQTARAISCLQIVFNAVFIGALIRVIFFQVNERAKESAAPRAGDDGSADPAAVRR